MNYSSANIQGWQSFSFTWATFLNCHEGFIIQKPYLLSKYDKIEQNVGF